MNNMSSVVYVRVPVTLRFQSVPSTGESSQEVIMQGEQAAREFLNHCHEVDSYSVEELEVTAFNVSGYKGPVDSPYPPKDSSEPDGPLNP